MIKIGDVVTVMMANGAEYVGKLKEDRPGYITLEDPKFVTMTEQGMGFANGIAATGKQDPKEVKLQNYSFVTETNPEVATAYRTAVSGLITSPSPGLKI